MALRGRGDLIFHRIAQDHCLLLLSSHVVRAVMHPYIMFVISMCLYLCLCLSPCLSALYNLMADICTLKAIKLNLALHIFHPCDGPCVLATRSWNNPYIVVGRQQSWLHMLFHNIMFTISRCHPSIYLLPSTYTRQSLPLHTTDHILPVYVKSQIRKQISYNGWLVL